MVNVKMLVFFSLLSALVLISAVPVRHVPAHRAPYRLLEEMVKTLNHLDLHLKDAGQNLTAKVIDKHKCKPEDFCRVEKVLSGIDHEEFRKTGKIVRQLAEYNKHFKVNCTIKTDTEIPLSEVLRDLRSCVQKKYGQSPVS